MDAKYVDIDGKTFNLANPEEKKAAIRAWLESKARDELGKKAPPPPSEDTNPLSPVSYDEKTAQREEQRGR